MKPLKAISNRQSAISKWVFTFAFCLIAFFAPAQDTAQQLKEKLFIDSISAKTSILIFNKWCDEHLTSKQNRELPFVAAYNLFLTAAWERRNKKP